LPARRARIRVSSRESATLETTRDDGGYAALKLLSSPLLSSTKIKV
jgi:hypothetical protein